MTSSPSGPDEGAAEAVAPSAEAAQVFETQPALAERIVVAEAHASGDPVLSGIAISGGLVGDLVRAYPGRDGISATPRWLEDWFQRRVESRFVGEDQPPLNTPSIDDVVAALSAEEHGVVRSMLLSVEPRYFRGFRTLAEPIAFSPGLTVIDGKNSSGKTSLAEALEWLFSGGLVRRSLRDLGNPRELANCVANQFRPVGEQTWVEAVFDLGGGSRLTLRRLLLEDYGATSTSPCTSKLFRDGTELAPGAEASLLDDLFAGSAPLLMQHTLRMFVQSNPSERRTYFERLLHLDELTQIIEKAVIGAPRLPEFPSPNGSIALRRWDDLKRMWVHPKAKTAVKRIDKVPLEELAKSIEDVLLLSATSSLALPGVTEETSFVAAAAAVERAQRAVRDASFPLLEALRPKRIVDDTAIAQLRRTSLDQHLLATKAALRDLADARSAATAISEAQIAVAQALSQLVAAGLIPSGFGRHEEAAANVSAITCPLCAHAGEPTLTTVRVLAVRQWEPARAALSAAEAKVLAAGRGFLAELRALASVRRQLLPTGPTEERWTTALDQVSESIGMAAQAFRDVASASEKGLSKFDAHLAKAGKAIAEALGEQAASVAPAATAGPRPAGSSAAGASTALPSGLASALASAIDAHEADLAAVGAYVAVVVEQARDYATGFAALEGAVGIQAKEDAAYRLREQWLAVAEDTSAVAHDLAWERAKLETQGALAEAREALMTLRQELLERRRQDFSSGMTRIWNTLRGDRYSAFSQLLIPPPRGKGFPVEIEVKAKLDDNVEVKEVDALRVFSESQVHALGVAAFVTRCSMLGHGFIVLDDPVQSMDEEHFLTFAAKLLPLLLDDGFQVIILTHNETFARDVSVAHIDRVDYATVEIQHSRRKGCRVERESRRVRERLRRARRAADDGDLKGAWYFLRLAIERLYTVAYVKHGPQNFKHASWAGQSAEAMYEYVGPILNARSPGSGERLKEILTMTAAGAHDKPARGATDVQNAADDIERVAKDLGVVD